MPIESAVSRESYCLVPSHLPASALLKRGPGWNSSGYNSTSSKKERNLHICFKDYVLRNLQALYQSSKVKMRHLGPKNDFYNFLDFLYLAWLSRYKSTIENNFYHQWRKTSGTRCSRLVSSKWFPMMTDRQTEWQPKYLALATPAQARRDQKWEDRINRGYRINNAGHYADHYYF